MSTETASETSGERGRTDLSEDDRHRLLASATRRTLLDIFANESHPISLEEIAEMLVELEEPGEEVDDATIEIATIELHHKHLPVLAELDLIEYDRAANRVEDWQTNIGRLTK